ncbi:MAG: PspC domain-containing protein [Bacteroidales bacterium]|nr:PspC domain-containing protein [Bacteroidales bacterium]
MSNYKRLERDLQNKVLGGVCSGLGNYFDMDPTFWRVLFFFLFFFGCSGLLIYIILWIVMPARQLQSGDVTNVQNSEAENGNDDPKKAKGNLTAGLILICIGAITLLARYIPQISWRIAWPVILIVIGLLLIIPKNKKS